MKRLILIAISLYIPLSAQPVLTAIANNASYSVQGLLNSGIAQGSLFAAFGRNLAPAGTNTIVSSFPIPNSMADVSMKITSGGTTVNALMIYVTEGQVGAILPSKTPTGQATVTLTSQGRTSPPFTITVVQRSFGIFTLNQGGTGPAVIQNFNSQTDQPVNTVITPAKPGQVVTLWGTGLGPASGDEAAAPVPGDLKPNLRVVVGSTDATVLYAGRSGCCAGVDQVQFIVPQETLGCYVPVVLYGPTLNTRRLTDVAPQSNWATMSVSQDGKTCTDPSGLTGDEINRMQQAGSSRVGSVLLELWHPFIEKAQNTTLLASFGKLDAASFLRSRGIFGYPALGTCLSYPVNEDSQSTPLVLPLGGLDAGGALTVQGPAGTLQALRKSNGSYASANTPATQFGLGNGHYTLSNGAGGADVGAFQAEFDVPAPLKWVNKQQVMEFNDIGSDVPFQWTGADPKSFVVVTSLGYNDFVGAFTMCTVDSSAGNFGLGTLPSIIAGIDGQFGGFPNIFQLGTVSPTKRFTATGLDLGLISVMLVDGVYVQ
jgi:uncharacterized protein (TIGR03437 family)